MVTTTFNEKELKEFKEIYQKSIDDGLTEFSYKGNEYSVSYAKYLIEYLESIIEKNEHSRRKK